MLETVDDVHVLTGALKLFFRELKEPLILWECVDKLLRACRAGSSPAKKASTLYNTHYTQGTPLPQLYVILFKPSPGPGH